MKWHNFADHSQYAYLSFRYARNSQLHIGPLTQQSTQNVLLKCNSTSYLYFKCWIESSGQAMCCLTDWCRTEVGDSGHEYHAAESHS